MSASDDTAQAAIRASRHAAALQSRFPLFVKPNAEGTSKGICPASRVHTAADLEHTVATLRQRCPGQALLIEPYLAGRELTVGIVGTGRRARVVGVVEYRWNQSQEGREDFFYWQNKVDAWDGVVQQVAVDVQSSPVVQEVCRMALAAWTVLHCRDGGRVDVRLDREGSPYILEVCFLSSYYSPVY